MSLPFAGEDCLVCNLAVGTEFLIVQAKGITLYASIAYALSFDVGIDTMPQLQLDFQGVHGCCNATFSAAGVYNVTIYDVQDLLFGDHVLMLRLVDTSGNLIGASAGGAICFDYAVVNEAALPPFSCASFPVAFSHASFPVAFSRPFISVRLPFLFLEL
jgi:hypothetical protein